MYSNTYIARRQQDQQDSSILTRPTAPDQHNLVAHEAKPKSVGSSRRTDAMESAKAVIRLQALVIDFA
jgi:hypothetical protein